MKRMLVAALACTQLSGCWFVFIPGPVVGAVSDGITGARGDHCVSSAAKVGDTINIDGRAMVIKSLSGTSSRCQRPEHPIRAELTPA